MRPGQAVDALVMRMLDADHVQLALGAILVEVKTEAPLAPGTRVQLAVKAAPEGLKLVLQHPPEGRAEGPASGKGSLAASPDPGGGVRGTGAGSAAGRDASAAPPAPHGASSGNAALTGAVRSAAAAQDGLAPLLADSAAALRLSELPATIRDAASRLLAFGLPVERSIEAEQLRRAFARSGLLLEANLENLAGAPPAGGAAATALPNDMKQALLALRACLTQWKQSKSSATTEGAPAAGAGAHKPAGAGPQAAAGPQIANAQALHRALLQAANLSATASPSIPVGPGAAGPSGASDPTPAADGATVAPASSPRPPPPYAGALPTAQPAAQASVGDGDTIETIAGTLLAEADAALARHTLLQAASLPDRPGGGGAPADGTGARWAFEIPFLSAQGAAVAQFEIARDRAQAAAEHSAPVWQARFSIDLEPLGPVHARVAVMGERAAVTLWAERPASAARLREEAPLLAEALRSAELDASEVVVRDGAPRLRPGVAASGPAGRFLDRAS